jgi:hypothetical protein
LWRELTVAIKPLKEQICRMISALGKPWRDLPGTQKTYQQLLRTG